MKILLHAFFVSLVNAQSDCSGASPNFSTPSKGSCFLGWERGNEYQYPQDFEGILNEVKMYTCPTSDLRVIISNGIPDHTVQLGNPNVPCEVNWALELPLNPTVETTKTEIPPRGIIAMAINGVAAYGAQEAGSANAVEPGLNGITDAQFWYGHPDPSSTWHFHNPHMGKEEADETTLLGYAMDGFPIYGPLEDNDDTILDECNGMYTTITDEGAESQEYRYHVRTVEQVDETAEYCNGNNPETNWNYILGCYSGSVTDSNILDSTLYRLPSDCKLDSSTKSPIVSPPTSSPLPSKAPAVMTNPPTLPPKQKGPPPNKGKGKGNGGGKGNGNGGGKGKGNGNGSGGGKGNGNGGGGGKGNGKKNGNGKGNKFGGDNNMQGQQGRPSWAFAKKSSNGGGGGMRGSNRQRRRKHKEGAQSPIM